MVTNGSGDVEIHRTFSGPWHGDARVVVGIDIGTTFSGVAFTFLQKGSDQLLYRVDGWPGQQNQNFNGRIPTLVCYDSNGRAVAVGAEALTRDARKQVDTGKWRLAEHFKLHLHPLNLRNKYGLSVKALPSGVSISQIYTDFLSYLLKHTEARFKSVMPDKASWEKYRKDAVFVIAHPNGWGIREQAFLRRVAAAAGLATSETAPGQVRFVTEAEASVHFCMHYTSLKSSLRVGKHFAVCDAGGSTVDTTLYTVEQTQPRLRLSETRGAACVQAGAIFVNQHAEKYLRQLFEDPEAGLTKEDANEYIGKCVDNFESQEKRRFNKETVEAEIEFAGSRFSNRYLEVEYGTLILPGSIVQSFFDPCVNEIRTSVQSQVSSYDVSHILLVGGFGASPYLCQQLKAQFDPTGSRVMTTNEATSKAVADGAVIWFCAEIVVKRAPQFAYGTDYAIRYDSSDPQHRGRETFQTPAGIFVNGGWSEIVAKDIPVDCDEVSRQSYSRNFWTPNPRLDKISDGIYAYEFGGLSTWLTKKSGGLNDGFQKICTVTADLNDMRKALRPGISVRPQYGIPCWNLSYDVCIRFGRTELTAFLEWEEGGTTKTGPATVVPISDIE